MSNVGIVTILIFCLRFIIAGLVNSDSVTDWVVCVDPKTKRQYYYSRSLSKSTWTAPPHLAAAAAAATGSNSEYPYSVSASFSCLILV
jgi:hypothetical protein